MKLTDIKEEVNSQTIRWKSQGLRMSVSMPSLMKRINRHYDEEKPPVFIRFREKPKPAVSTSLAELPSEHSESSCESLSEQVEGGKQLPKKQEYGDIGITQRGSLPPSSNVSRLEEEEYRVEVRNRVLLLIGNPQFTVNLKTDLRKLGLGNTDEAGNLDEAMEMYRALTRNHAIYLVIFADLSTPSLNGHAFVRNIRQHERITHIRRSFICGIGSELPLDLLDTASNP